MKPQIVSRRCLCLAVTLLVACKTNDEQPRAGQVDASVSRDGGMTRDADASVSACGEVDPRREPIRCTSASACTARQDCAATLEPQCTSSLGTSCRSFHLDACSAGHCAYWAARTTCVDLTPDWACACPASPTTEACADCCAQGAGGAELRDAFDCGCSLAAPCAAACGSSRLCGQGELPTSDCVACIRAELQPAGACSASDGCTSSSCSFIRECLRDCRD
jgi:hypothetical protein